MGDTYYVGFHTSRYEVHKIEADSLEHAIARAHGSCEHGDDAMGGDEMPEMGQLFRTRACDVIDSTGMVIADLGGGTGVGTVMWVPEIKPEMDPAPDMTDEVIRLLDDHGPLARHDVIEKLGLADDRPGKAGVSNALTDLVRIGAVARTAGKYHRVAAS